ncbi:MAG: hypothetical protein FWE12_00020 [Oscillospiraceae bacterium]|nr:hypothetical protein [Oscillospiraceae bacterium]
MMIYCVPYAPIPNRAAFEALLPPARLARLQGEGSGALFAYALLAFALEQHAGVCARNAVAYTEAGKPYLVGHPEHFSLSHSKTHALCVVAEFPIGCDIETHRVVSERVRRRVLGEAESSGDFFAQWVLKESCVKLSEDAVVGTDVWGWLYHEVPGCTAAVVAHKAFKRPPIMILSAETLFSFADEKWA